MVFLDSAAASKKGDEKDDTSNHDYGLFHLKPVHDLETVTKKMTLAKKWVKNEKSTILVQ